MHGIVAVLIAGVITLIIWFVKIPNRKVQKQRYNEFSKKFDEWNRK